jgi:hypothetical protein
MGHDRARLPLLSEHNADAHRPHPNLETSTSARGGGGPPPSSPSPTLGPPSDMHPRRPYLIVCSPRRDFAPVRVQLPAPALHNCAMAPPRESSTTTTTSSYRSKPSAPSASPPRPHSARSENAPPHHHQREDAARARPTLHTNLGSLLSLESHARVCPSRQSFALSAHPPPRPSRHSAPLPWPHPNHLMTTGGPSWLSRARAAPASAPISLLCVCVCVVCVYVYSRGCVFPVLAV